MGEERALSRRAFIASTAALGAAAAVAGTAAQTLTAYAEDDKKMGATSSDATEIKHAWCQMCGPAKTACSTLCHIKDGRWVHVEGNPEAGNNYGRGSKTLCAKGNAAMQVLYDPARLTHPMKRVGEKGEGKFERTTWDEAYKAISDKLK